MKSKPPFFRATWNDVKGPVALKAMPVLPLMKKKSRF
jgi:hypothetical protein